MMTIDEAIRKFRSDPQFADLVRDAYFDRDVTASTKRFYESNEFAEVKKILGKRVNGAAILDLGAGTGIASYAFIQSGARIVYAVEPDSSDEVGREAILRWSGNYPVELVDAFAEHLPLDDASVDIFYGRQVLHHIHDLPAAMREAYRVLKRGGMFIACREHVVDDEHQLAVFLKNHPMHQLAGGENAYSLDAYMTAIQGSNLQLKQVISPLDSVINAYPDARSNDELALLKRRIIQHKLGPIGAAIAELPVVGRYVWRLRKPIPGRLYSFIAVKPS